MTDGKLQWHPVFSAVFRIELAPELKRMQMEAEHLLAKKPLQIDILVVKKKKEEKIQKNIGQIFRTHNIIEYKSPDDYLSIHDFYKIYGYACLYQSDTEKDCEIDPEEITITFVCNHYPGKMLEHIRKVRGMTVKKHEEGIYHLLGDAIPMQLIITKELSKEKNFWMQSLRKDLKSGGEIRALLERYEENKDESCYQAVMDVISRANWKEFEEERAMCDALKELFAEDFAASRAEGEAIGKSTGIQLAVKVMKLIFQIPDISVQELSERCQCSEEAVLEIRKAFEN